MKKISLLICFLFFCILIFNQCKKREQGKLLGTYSFTDQDLKIVPYLGGDFITMIDSLNDTIHYKIGNTFHKTTIRAYNPDHYVNQDNVDYEDYYALERADMGDTQGSLGFELDFTTPFKEPVKKYIIINLSIKSHPEICYFMSTYDFDNGNLYQYVDELSYNDSINLVNHKFYSVYKLTSHALDIGSSTDSISNLFYSVNQGLIGLRTKKGHTWRLN